MKQVFQIYEQSTEVTRYVFPNQNIIIPITTRIIMEVRENIFGTWFNFNIIQNNIRKSLYDGEYSNNDYIQAVMNTARTDAGTWLNTHKSEYITKYKNGELNKKSK